jgi:hypothetical protein
MLETMVACTMRGRQMASPNRILTRNGLPTAVSLWRFTIGLVVVAALLIPVTARAAQQDELELQKDLDAGLDFARRPDANQQIEAAKKTYSEAQVEIKTDFLKVFSTTLKNAADFGKFLSEVRDFDQVKPATPEFRALLDTIRPVKGQLPKLDESQAKTFDRLSKAYDLIDSIGKDLANPPHGSYTVLSSNTFEQLMKFGLDSLLDDTALKQMISVGSIKGLKNLGVSAAFARGAGVVSFGGADIAAGIGRAVGSGHWNDLEAVTNICDGINKTAWGGLGLALSGGNRAVADAFAEAGGGLAWAAREATAPAMIAWQMKQDGVGETIIAQYEAVQRARIAKHLGAQSLEAFLGFDPQLIAAISPEMRHAVNARFGQTSPALNDNLYSNSFISRRSQDNYREVCKAGWCVRTAIAAAPDRITIKPAPLGPQDAHATPPRTEPAGIAGNVDPVGEIVDGSDLKARIRAGRTGSAAWDIKP